MKLTIENQQIASTIQLLDELSLKGKESRHRSKLQKALKGHLEEVAEQEQALLKEHCRLDEKGNIKLLNEGEHYDVIDPIAFKSEQKELYQETFTVEGSNMEETLQVIKMVLEESEVCYSGKQAEAYDLLCEELEKVDE